MYVKKIDIVGFKSFANKTTIYFSNGVTAIVGPNGCGKTNVLDALRWVLGEQKVTLLRGSKMEEVIFNGSRDAKPLGMSEVTLTLINNRGVLPTEYSEVQITRRLFRSGESEYLLNKVPCRLKDISELFYDTGVGAHSYSVIQQDMIEAVISDKAEERRFLFEEAAGITKYKQRRKAAVRKLDATENDFLRLNDIHAEVQTQVRSLNRQYRKAERYQKVKDAIKAWELYLNADRLKTIENERREVRASVDSLTDQLSGRETSLDSVSAALETDRKEQIDLEHRLNGIGTEAYDASEKAHTLENEISVLREKRSHARELIERNQNDIKALVARSELLTEQIGETEGELNLQKADVESIATRLAGSETSQVEADRALLAARAGKDQENRKLIDLEGRISSGRTEEENVRRQEEELNNLLANADKEIAENQTTEKDSLGHHNDAQEKLNQLVGNKAETDEKIVSANNELAQLTEQIEELTQEIATATASIEACLARKNLLKEMMLSYEGYESGAVAAMESRDRWPAIVSTVAEAFVPTEGLEVAVEAALGELAGFVICGERKTAEEIIRFLQSEGKGRVGILVPDSGTLNPLVKRPELDLPEFTGWMDAFVSTSDNLRPLMEAVLSRVAVFEAGADPSQLLERLPYGFKAVSTDGTLYSKNVIAGGSEDKFPLFRRKEKVAEQEQAAATLQQTLGELENRRNQTTARQAALRTEITGHNENLVLISEEIEQVQQKLNDFKYRLQTIGNEIARVGREKQATSGKLEQLRQRQYDLGLDTSSLSGEKASLMSSITASDTELEKLEVAAAACQEKVSNLQIETVEARSHIEQTESKITHQSELKNELDNTRVIKSEEIDQARELIEQSGGQIDDLEGNLKETFEQRNKIGNRQNLLRSSQGELQEKVNEKEAKLKLLRSEKDELSSKLHQFDIRLTTIESEVNSIQERIREDHDVDIRSIEAPSPDETITADQAAEQLQTLKEKVKKFGLVNLLALEEYQVAFDREKFLREQLEDLTAAKKDLNETIGRINNTARQLFEDTLTKVQEHFQKLFIELFTGGEASIHLEDPSDPLESNIVISARPKGKKLLPITMMSGGERALTAISLLFSLYMVKPSPFCILDEIDAPLDDANCHRFLKIIASFSKQTQFITITHNKITMEAAHNLYGITMEQPGISKLVAVKFNDIAGDVRAAEDLVNTSVADDLVEKPETTLEAPAIIQEQPVEIVADPVENTPLPETVVDRLTPTVTVSVEDDADDTELT